MFIDSGGLWWNTKADMKFEDKDGEKEIELWISPNIASEEEGDGNRLKQTLETEIRCRT